MDEKDVIIAACAATIIAGSVLLQSKTRKKRTQWMKSWLAERDKKRGIK